MKNRLLLPLLAIFLVITLVSCYFIGSTTNTTSQSSQSKPENIEAPDTPDRVPLDYLDTFFLIDALFQNFSIYDIDQETAMLAAIRAYVDATGDKHAMYYTPEEYEELLAENNGDLYGIGVQVVFDYDEYFMEIVLLMPDSPAEKCLLVGDKVTHIKVDGEWLSLIDLVEEYKIKVKELYPSYTDEEVNTLACYEAFQYSISKIKGAEGTYTEIIVERDAVQHEFIIQRSKVKTVSVTGKVSVTNSKVGIIHISEFDLTTPVQFKECMDSLIAKGCNKFVFDLRNNPGGAVASVVAILSTILNEGDIILSTNDYQGNNETIKVGVVNYAPTDDYHTCNVSKSEIGQYRGYDMVVLVNENSASASEIFTAALRDYNLANIVGVKTYGKGSIQNVIPLSYYGSSYYGALRLTTKLYFPPCGEGFNGGIGITPDYIVELEGIAAETNFYKLTEDIDNQLQKAISVLINK